MNRMQVGYELIVSKYINIYLLYIYPCSAIQLNWKLISASVVASCVACS